MEVSTCIPQFLKLYDDMAIFSAEKVITKYHSHHAVEIMISFDSPCTLIMGDETAVGGGLLLHHDVSHAVKADGFVVLIYINPETLLGKKLDHILGCNTVLALDDTLVEQLKAYITEVVAHQYSDTEVAAYLTSVLVKDIVQMETNDTSDVRIGKVITHIKSNLDRPFNFHDLKEIACLSESRLIHLFKKEIGIPIRKYVLWWRLHQAIKLYLTGQTLTQSAHLAGFSDVAHLNRTFVSMFGLNPSQILKNFN